MSDRTCPFDGDFCDLKKKAIAEWRKSCWDNPTTFISSGTQNDWEHYCPYKGEERYDACVRYSRYVHIVDKVMAGVDEAVRNLYKQNNEQR